MARLTAVPIALALVACGGGDNPLLTASPRCELPAEPYQLARLVRCPVRLALDDTHIYWLDGERLMRFPKCGSSAPPEQLAATGAYELALDDEAIYLTDLEVLRVPKTGGAPVSIGGLPSWAEQVWADADAVYASTQGVCIAGQPCPDLMPLIWRFPPEGGGARVVFAHSGGQVFDLIVDDGVVFFTGNLWGLPTVVDRVPVTGGPAQALLPEGIPASGSSLALDGGYVYFISDRGVRRVARGGSTNGEAPLVAEEPLGVGSFTVDGEHIYWTSGWGADGRLMRGPAGGGEATTLIVGTDPYGIAVDRGAVYYATCRDGDDAAIWILTTAL